jgi:hypothetical protein
MLMVEVMMMWRLFNGMTPMFNGNGGGVRPLQLLFGAGIGIAAWEFIRRRNPAMVNQLANAASPRGGGS